MRRFRLGLVAALGAASACGDGAAPARPQVLLVIDTNLPVAGQMTGRDDLSRAAAIDSVRIDVLKDGAIAETREIVAPDVRDWPITLGLLPPTGGLVHLRVRAFRNEHSRASRDEATREPLIEVTVDRVVAVSFPTEGVRRLKVRLEGDCRGVPSSFTSPYATCVDAAQTATDPSRGLEALGADAPLDRSDVGTWRGALFTPCTAPPPAGDVVCIPGGFTIIGEKSLDGVGGLAFAIVDAVPLRPVRLSPFYIDRHEVTVGRVRLLGASALGGDDLPLVPAGADTADCTFRGFADGGNDDLPLNCTSIRTARRVCALSGGALSTEAQWEYTARGRGDQRYFPWGSARSSECCTMSTNRRTRAGLDCGDGVEPVGSHADPSKCRGPVDVSRDGVEDLAGSLREVMGDALEPYDAPCWGGVGIAIDPTCPADGASHVVRGGAWVHPDDALAFAPLRSSTSDTGAVDTAYGFRCVYAGAP